MKVAVCANPIKDNDFVVTRKTVDELKRLGADTKVCMPPVRPEVLTFPEWLKIVDISDALDDADFLICLGGDGTILHASKEASRKNVPVIGINLGQRGFMAEIETDELSLLKNVIEGKYSIENRMMLNVMVNRSGEDIFSQTALNDVVVGKGSVQRIIDIKVCADGFSMMDFSGDGVVVSTPTGSTAYSMSAGGPIIEPSAENIVVTPICAHSLNAKPYILSPERTVSITLGELTGRAAYLSADGDTEFGLKSGDVISVVKSQRNVKLIRVSDRSFYENIRDKLNRPRGDRI